MSVLPRARGSIGLAFCVSSLLAGCLSTKQVEAPVTITSTGEETADLLPADESVDSAERPAADAGTPIDAGSTTLPPACTKYVAASGSVGGHATTYKTIQEGVDSLAAGDTLCVATGTYHETIMVKTAGTAAAPITIRAFDFANKPVVDGQYTLPAGADYPSGCVPTSADRVAAPQVACAMSNTIVPQASLVVLAASYVSWNGIDVVHSKGGGMFAGEWATGSPGFIGRVVDAAHPLSVTHLEIRNSTIAHLRGYGVNIFYADGVLFDANDEYDSNNYASFDRAGNSQYAWGNGLSITAKNLTVSNSKFHEQFSEPLQIGGFVTTDGTSASNMYTTNVFRSGVGITIEHNVFYDNWAMEGPYVGDVQGAVIDSNVIYSSGDSTYFRSGVPQSCLQIDSETGIVGGNALENVVVSNNVISNCYSLINMQQFYSGSTYASLSIYNNTLLNPYPGGTIIVNNMTRLTGFSFVNNLSYAPGLYMSSTTYDASQGHAPNSQFAAVSGAVLGNNLWSSTPSANLAGAHDVVLAAGDSAGLTTPSYRPTTGIPYDTDAIKLTASSVAIGAGRALSAVMNDFFSDSRSSAYDIGADQR